MFAVSAVTAVWGFASYVGFVRLQVDLAYAGSRVDAAGRSRARLVGNLVEGCGTFAILASDSLARLDAAAVRAARPLTAAGIIDDPERYEDFRAAQANLSDALAEVWSGLQNRSDSEVRLIVEDFDSRLRRTAVELDEDLARLDASIEAYQVAVGRFPGSFVAGIAGFDVRTPIEGVLSQ
jgi:LemA protein